jgi:hypothetical protein
MNAGNGREKNACVITGQRGAKLQAAEYVIMESLESLAWMP